MSVLGKRVVTGSVVDHDPKRQKISPPSLAQSLEAGKNRFPELLYSLSSAEKFLVCTRKDLHNHPPIGMISLKMEVTIFRSFFSVKRKVTLAILKILLNYVERYI